MTDRPFASRGHGAGHWTIDVRVSSASRSAYAELRPGSVFPEGTLIAALQHDPQRGRPRPIYVMHRNAAGWSFTVVDPDGFERATADVDLCRRCHAEAVSDQVFGLPASLER